MTNSHPLRNVLIFGATGMIGQGVLRECLADPEIQRVHTLGRSPTGQIHAKLEEIVHADLFDYTGLEKRLNNLDACFFCLGTTSAGKSEAEYSRVTYELTLAAAQTLARFNPQMAFVYVSAEGADPSEKGPIMWARVRGRLENALASLPFRAVYVFRPGMVRPLDGIESRTPAYRVLYKLGTPLWPVLRALMPQLISSTRELGRAMIAAARFGSAQTVHRTRDFAILAARTGEARTG